MKLPWKTIATVAALISAFAAFMSFVRAVGGASVDHHPALFLTIYVCTGIAALFTPVALYAVLAWIGSGNRDFRSISDGQMAALASVILVGLIVFWAIFFE
jgi:hypothetical protein